MPKPSALSVTLHVHDAQWKALLSPYRKTVQAACEAAADEMRWKHAGEVAVVLANDAFVRQLNHQYRGKDKPTNVLSFPGDGESLGDIVLARQTVAKEAKAQGKTFKAHATHLLVHGMLHLSGHDHAREKEAAAMEALEIRILKKLGVSNPYL